MQQPLIFDIKRYSINDGPGIRVTIFFKGCPLHCLWCHNPESISPKVQKLFTASKCIRCGECCRVCPVQACTLAADGIITDEDLCTLCGECAEVCPTLATEMSGRYYSIDELLNVIERERPFFQHSGGGVTFSGGEPLLCPDFLIELLQRCGERQIHRAVDTSGYVKQETLLRVAKHTDLFLYDLKVMDPVKHEEYTGLGNSLILRNLEALAETGARVRVRIPLIGGVNDDVQSVTSFARFISGLAGEKKDIDLLPFHDIARAKDEKLGQVRDLIRLEEPTSDMLRKAESIFTEHGLSVSFGG